MRLAALLITATLVGCGDEPTITDNRKNDPSSPAEQAAPKADTAAEAKLKTYLEEAFGGGYTENPANAAEWYGDITGVRVDGKTAYIETSYFNDGDVQASSRAMCVAAAGAGRPGSPLHGKLEVVQVLDQKGGPITECGPRTPPS